MPVVDPQCAILVGIELCRGQKTRMDAPSVRLFISFQTSRELELLDGVGCVLEHDGTIECRSCGSSCEHQRVFTAGDSMVST